MFSKVMTYERAPFFPHRRNPDGSFTSICLTCCAIVASHKTDEELVELDKKHICETAPKPIPGMRTPKVGDRIAIPKHAVIFVVKSVNESKKTVNAKAAIDAERIEEDVPWQMLTIIDP
jgi:hypothetical protein